MFYNGFNFSKGDAVWWWLNSLKEYTLMAPDGFAILDSQLIRLYPSDDAENPSDADLTDKKGVIVKLRDLVQEALQVHVTGLKFRERNAGRRIDEHMHDDGFNNEIGVDLETGFVFGGKNNLFCFFFVLFIIKMFQTWIIKVISWTVVLGKHW